MSSLEIRTCPRQLDHAAKVCACFADQQVNADPSQNRVQRHVFGAQDMEEDSDRGEAQEDGLKRSSGQCQAVAGSHGNDSQVDDDYRSDQSEVDSPQTFRVAGGARGRVTHGNDEQAEQERPVTGLAQRHLEHDRQGQQCAEPPIMPLHR